MRVAVHPHLVVRVRVMVRVRVRGRVRGRGTGRGRRAYDLVVARDEHELADVKLAAGLALGRVRVRVRAP